MIIGISGKARSGKDAIATYLTTEHGFQRRALADSLKDAARSIFGWDDDHVHGTLKETVDRFWGFSPRWALQKMGTEAMRDNFSEDVWIRSLRKYIDTHSGKPFVVPDVRFPDEAQAIRDWGGILIRITRPGIEPVGIDGHVSETALDDWRDWDFVVDNDGDLSDLWQKVDDMVSKVGV